MFQQSKSWSFDWWHYETLWEWPPYERCPRVAGLRNGIFGHFFSSFTHFSLSFFYCITFILIFFLLLVPFFFLAHYQLKDMVFLLCMGYLQSYCIKHHVLECKLFREGEHPKNKWFDVISHVDIGKNCIEHVIFMHAWWCICSSIIIALSMNTMDIVSH